VRSFATSPVTRITTSIAPCSGVIVVTLRGGSWLSITHPIVIATISSNSKSSVFFIVLWEAEKPISASMSLSVRQSWGLLNPHFLSGALLQGEANDGGVRPSYLLRMCPILVETTLICSPKFLIAVLRVVVFLQITSSFACISGAFFFVRIWSFPLVLICPLKRRVCYLILYFALSRGWVFSGFFIDSRICDYAKYN